MMINKRLIGSVRESKKYVAGNVICQWISLAANIVLMGTISAFLGKLLMQSVTGADFGILAGIAAGCILLRIICTKLTSKMSYLSSKSVKHTLRKLIFEKLFRLGASYKEKTATSEVVQVAVEGVEQLETYFGAYLPQFFYAMIAPLTLFGCLVFVNWIAALVLFICVPLIPVSIALVQTWAKKLLSKYWGQYTSLGDTFLENLQGLTTLKVYQSDQFKNEEMNVEAEKFRKITMKVLVMQLNSITIMDLIAYGGAALGMILAVTQFWCGNLSFMGCVLIILLSADFFLPMRQLGSFFHIAMNGMAASDKIFNLLDLPEPKKGTQQEMPKSHTVRCSGLSFSYNKEKEILHSLDLTFPQGGFAAIVGKSGCGKSTLASILTGKNKNYTGSVSIGDTELCDLQEECLLQHVTYIGFDSYLFKGTVRENLQMGRPAEDNTMWSVLEQVNLAEFMRSQNGLDTVLNEKASNLSGGQRQRLALARAILHESDIYIFDEATSNIDVESENEIMEQIYALAKTKTVILISHRLANVVNADKICVLEQGRLAEEGTHAELLQKNSVYAELYASQQALEHFERQV